MQKRSFHLYFLKTGATITVKTGTNLMKQVIISTILALGFTAGTSFAQDTLLTRTPEEQRELFGYCEKADLMKQLKFSSEMADKVGDIDMWALVQQKSITANTNDAYATFGEVKQEVLKKYKAFLSGDQVKSLTDFKQARLNNLEPCAVITLSYNHIFDTIPPLRALQLYKVPNRKPLIDKLGINGRQADMLFETEVWKQKESLTISAIPVPDFNRVRRTVSMYKERENKYKAIGLSDDQIDAAIQFFKEHQLGPKQ